MKSFLFVVLSVLILAVLGSGFFLILLSSKTSKAIIYPKPRSEFWAFRSIDTMKHSRDLAREKLSDLSYDSVIDQEVRLIAETGASHVAIGTPYDEEFVSYLSRWVSTARRYNLKVWFRGNFSGWEGWFGYPTIDQDEHRAKLRDFLARHGSLFEDGDAFSPCPECENGGPGDPRQTGDVAGFRRFLISEYEAAKDAFEQSKKRVLVNTFSMNGDVAQLIMDRSSTAMLGGMVTVDHYVKTPERLGSDLSELASKSGGSVLLGEFGAPIPDIHGQMSEDDQAKWLEEALHRLVSTPALFGVNYWTNMGSSTALWSDEAAPRKVVSVLSRFFHPEVFYGTVVDELGEPISGARISVGVEETKTNSDGYFEIRAPLAPSDSDDLMVSSEGFIPTSVSGESSQMQVSLRHNNETLWFRVRRWIREHIPE